MAGFDFNAKLNFAQLPVDAMKEVRILMTDSGYNSLIATPVIEVFDKDNSSRVTIRTDNFNYTAEDIDEEKLETIASLIKKLMNILDIKVIEICTVRFFDAFESEDAKACEFLARKVKYDFSEEDIKDISGVGYRFLTKENDICNEFKIEPLISDMDKLFVEGMYNKVKFDTNEIKEYFDSAFKQFCVKVDFFISN